MTFYEFLSPSNVPPMLQINVALFYEYIPDHKNDLDLHIYTVMENSLTKVNGTKLHLP